MSCTENGSTEPATPAPLIGDLVAQKYRIIDLLARGGMGTVYAAQHVTLNTPVALKWVRVGCGDAQLSAEREAFAARRARHPNVVEVIETVRDRNEVFIVMELLRGETLALRLGRSASKVEELVALLLPAMRGLARAHRRGVTHRDIAPSNLFVCQRATSAPAVKIIDFGLAEVAGQRPHRLGPQPKRAFGTPMYMSSEQLMGRSDVDTRSDVYSFSAVLYEVLAGRAPFEAATIREVILKASSVPAPPLREFNPYVSRELEELLSSAMNKDRDLRPPSLRALVAALERTPLWQVGGPPNRAASKVEALGNGDCRKKHQPEPPCAEGCESEQVALSLATPRSAPATAPLSHFELCLSPSSAPELASA